MRQRLRLREGWSSLVLLLLVLLTMASTFVVGGLAEELHILPVIVLCGALVGFGIAKSRLPGILAHPLGLAIGLACCFLLLSTLVPASLAARWAGIDEHDTLAVLGAKAQLVGLRLQMWISAAMQGQTSTDTLPFAVQMAALGWLAAFYGAWFVFRTHWVWGAVVPPGVATFLGVYYGPPRLLIHFVVYLLWALILIVRANVFQREREWQAHQTVYDRLIELEFMRDGALLAALVLAVVWFVPRPQTGARLGDFWTSLQGPWQRVQEEWSRLYAAISYREQTGLTTFGHSVTLGGAVSMSSTPVLEVRASEGHYWRAVVLDRYTGQGWVDTGQAILRLSAGAPLTDRAAYQARRVLTQTVTFLRPGETLLLAAPEPLRTQLPTRVQAGLQPGGAFEASAVYAASAVRGRLYVVQSLVSVASVRELRQAGIAYPAWVAGRYLQLPDSLPGRISELAYTVAGDLPTPYDRAVAIEAYLRQLRYNLSIDAPPAGRDPVDWFLFDYREGYCTYFASAMVLMCRTLGMPARLAQGYSRGEYLADRQAFVVRESDAHAWPEVYFPGYGWIEFEPTPSQPALVRPSGEEGEAPGAGPGQPGEEGRDEERYGPDLPLPPIDNLGDSPYPGERAARSRSLWRLVGLGALLLAGAGALAWRYLRRWRALRPAEQLYLRLIWVSGLLGVSAHPYQTPLELARALGQALGPGGPQAWRIAELYVRERFGAHPPAEEEVAAARRAWGRLSPIIVRQAGRRLVSRVGWPGRGDVERRSWTELRPR